MQPCSTSSASSQCHKASFNSDSYFTNCDLTLLDKRKFLRLLRRSRMSRSSFADVVNTISIVSDTSVDKDINEVKDMPSAICLTTAPQVATSPSHSRTTETSDSAPDTPDSSTTCSWCGRTGGTWEPGSSLSCTVGITSNAGRFCSEACFAAGRRAAFKRARTCDWCRHLRHSVSYVDFQDGENQLQFCSDKCLNQYKMNIFCRETQSYLALHGLTSISSTSNPSIGDGLITPELWLQDCQPSRSGSLDDEALVVDDEPLNWSSDCGLESEERERLVSDTNSSILNSPIQMPDCKQIKSEEKDSEDSSTHDFYEETIKLAIKESLKDEEYRRYKQRKEEMDSFKSFSACVESKISTSKLPTNNITAKTCRRSKSSPESLKASSPYSDSLGKGTIFIKDVRKLLKRDPEKERNSIHQTQCRIPINNTMTAVRNNTAATNTLPVSFHLPQMTSSQPFLKNFPTLHQPFTPPHQMPTRFNSNPANFSIPSPSSPNVGMRPRLPIHSFHTKIPSVNPQFNLIPPVTVVVPYPIPIPIPLPIPIPQSLFEKYFNSKNFSKKTNEKENNTSPNAEIPITPQDLSQRSKLKNKQSCSPEQNLSMKAEKISAHSDSSTSSSASAASLNTVQPSFSSSITNSSKGAIVLPVLPFSSMNDNQKQRSLRKRKHLQSESQGEIDLRLKRKNNFVPV